MGGLPRKTMLENGGNPLWWKSALPDRCAPAPALAVLSIIFRLTILAFKLSQSPLSFRPSRGLFDSLDGLKLDPSKSVLYLMSFRTPSRAAYLSVVS